MSAVAGAVPARLLISPAGRRITSAEHPDPVFDSDAQGSVGGRAVANRLTNTSAGASLAYDPLGRLGQTTSSSNVITQFAYDGDNLIAEYDSTGAVLRRYVFGPGGDEPLAHYEYQNPVTPSGTIDLRWLLANDEVCTLEGATIADGIATTSADSCY